MDECLEFGVGVLQPRGRACWDAMVASRVDVHVGVSPMCWEASWIRVARLWRMVVELLVARIAVAAMNAE